MDRLILFFEIVFLAYFKHMCDNIGGKSTCCTDTRFFRRFRVAFLVLLKLYQFVGVSIMAVKLNDNFPLNFGLLFFKDRKL